MCEPRGLRDVYVSLLSEGFRACWTQQTITGASFLYYLFIDSSQLGAAEGYNFDNKKVREALFIAAKVQKTLIESSVSFQNVA